MIIKQDFGEIDSGEKGEHGYLTVSTGTEYTIETGLPTINTFMACGGGAASGNASTMIYYDSSRQSSTVIQGGGSTTITNKGSTLPISNTASLIGLVSITNGDVVIKTPTSNNVINGSIYWSAT